MFRKRFVQFYKKFYVDIYACIIFLCVIVVDQISKQLILAHYNDLVLTPQSVIGPYLDIVATHNNGAAFSLFSNSTFLLVVILFLVGGLSFFYYRAVKLQQHRYKLQLAATLGGAVSNVIDRVLHGGYVTDFISFNIPQLSFHFAIFNLADAVISISVCLLLFQLFFQKDLQGKSERSDRYVA